MVLWYNRYMNPFDFINSITYTKQDIMHDLNESEY